MHRHLIVAALLGALLLSSSAVAQSDAELRRSCFDWETKPAVVIKSCDAVIAAPQSSVSDRVKALIHRAHAHGDEEHYRQAIADLDSAAALDPGNLDVVRRRAIELANNGLHERAIQDFDKLIATQPGDARTFWMRCASKVALGRAEAALPDCNEALRLKPNYLFALETRGLAYLKLKKYQLAIADFSGAVDDGLTGMEGALAGRGIARILLGDTQRGEADLEKALELDPDILRELYRRGLRETDMPGGK